MTKHLKRMVSMIAATAMLAPTMTLGVSAATYATFYDYYVSNPSQSIIPGKSWFTVSLSEEGSNYVLYDQTRNIKFVKSTLDGDYNFLTNKKLTQNSPNRPAIPKVNEMVSFSKSTNLATKTASYEQQALATLYQVQSVYDRYARLGYSDFGAGSSNTLYVALNSAAGQANSNVGKYHINGNLNDNKAGNLADYAWLCFSEKAQNNAVHNYMAADEDIVGHELTHIMLLKRFGWTTTTNNLETQAIMEAYCDILGELLDSNTDWRIGSESYVIKPSSGVYSLRDLRAPANTKAPESYYQGTLQFKNHTFYTNYKDYSQAIKQQPGLNYIYGSTVLSHAAYKMYNNGIYKDLLTQIWFQSLNYLSYFCKPQFASFADVREAVTVAANSVLYNRGYSASEHKKYIGIINQAFDEADIPAMRYTTTRQNQAANTSNMADFIRAESRKYPTGKYWSNGDIESYSSTIGSTSINKIIVNATFDKGYNKSFNYEIEEPYYECAGFAKKLQMDYFGTTKFLHIDENENSVTYEPRIGDHLRITSEMNSRYEENGAHSIFVSGVKQNTNGTITLTYADCNSDGNNIIGWNKQISYDLSTGRVGSGRFGYGYQVMWVERPIMLGDVNGDSFVNTQDLNLMQTLINRGSTYSTNSTTDLAYRNFAADVNKDGKITSSDKTLLNTQLNNTSGISLVFVK